MKKSLFAVAATGAFAAASGVAQAQSSVTVYGILDVGYTNGSVKQQTGTSAYARQNVSRISNSMESGSRIGFRGTEDLGGGTRANFVFELGMQPAGNAGSNADGSVPAVPTQSSSSNAGAPNWTPNVRQAFVGLAQKGIGEVRIGTQNTFVWEQAGSNTTGQLNQTAGSMLAPTIDGAFFGASNLRTTLDASLASGSSLAAFTNRTTNTITFRTERMAGIQAKAGAVLSNQNNNQTTPASNGNGGGYSGGSSQQYGWMGALDWNIQKANIQAAYQVFTSEGPFGANNVAVNTAANGNASSVTNAATYFTNTVIGSTAAAWGSGTQGTNVTDAQTLITASYDFGILRAYAGWGNRKITSVINSNNYLKRTAQEIGVRGYVTKTVEGWASVGNGRYSAYGSSSPTANITGYQVGTNYWMSKRTNLYAIYGQNSTSTTTTGAAAVSQASVGIRHTF